jgi:adenine-specific DNA-methyltransferase
MAIKIYDNYSHDQLIEEIKKLNKRKKYGLVWEKEKTKEKFETESEGKLPVLVEDKDREITTDPSKPFHILIEGDNYHALSVLNYTHSKSIDVIYIDPPYNTGENDFKYNDKFVDKEDGFRHSKWLSFMDKRLRLAKNLLKETGVIIIHIDENEFDSLNVLLESSIFLEKNNLGTIVWNKKNPKGDAKGVSTMHEYIFCYAKNKEAFLKLKNTLTRKKPNAIEILKKAKSLYSKIGKSVIPDEVLSVIKPFNYKKNILKDFIVKYDLDLVNKEFQTWIASQDFSGGEKAYKFIDKQGDVYRGVSMAWPNKEKAPSDYFIPLIHPITKKKCPVPERGWRNPSSTMKSLLEKKLILFGEDEKKQPERKYLLKENMYENTPSLYNFGSSDDDFFKQVGVNFPYAKPVEVAKYLISSIHPSPDIVLDFFAGSGTALHAVLDLNETNKQCILVTNDENKICTEVCYPRIKKVIKGYKNIKGDKIEGLGGNLKYYKTNFVGSEPTHRNKKLLTDKSIEMLCIKENTFNEVLHKKDIFIFSNKDKYAAILFNEMKIQEFKNEIIKLKLPISVYVFSLEGDDFKEEFEGLDNNITLCSIPEAILKVYRRIYWTGQFKSKK